MMGSRVGRFIIALLFITVVLGVQQGFKITRNLVAHAETTIQVKNPPSPAPIGMLGIYINTGFSLQPDDNYTYVKHAKMLTTATAHSIVDVFNPMASDHFQWAQTVDEGKTWTDVDGANQADLTITPESVGTVYYQQRFRYYAGVPLFWPSTYYSHVAALTTLPAPVPATALSVKTDNDYLYNNQEGQKTYVHATPTPANATGSLSWSSSDEQLATVKSTGEVTANTSGNKGTAFITGTMTNDDGTKVSQKVAIEIGGGIDDQTVNEGQSATFQVRGNFDQAPNSVTWHRVDGHGDKVISQGNQLSYTLAATQQADDQAQYYAVVTVKMKGASDQTITTNRARLTVIPNRTPMVKIDNTIENLTNASGNTPTQLANVVDGDVCRIDSTVTDTNLASTLVEGDYMVKLPSDVTNTVITVDGQKAYYYPVSDESDTIIVASGQSFVGHKQHKFSIEFMTHKTQGLSYTTSVQLMGYADTKRNKDLGTYSGNKVGLNFTDGNLHLAANDVDFGRIAMEDLGKVFPGKVAGGGDLLDVTDYRRKKEDTKIDLSQTAPFSSGLTHLNASLGYDSGKGAPLRPLSSVPQEVTTIPAGTIAFAIGGNQGQNLAVKVADGGFTPGRYTSQILWTVVSAP